MVDRSVVVARRLMLGYLAGGMMVMVAVMTVAVVMVALMAMAMVIGAMVMLVVAMTVMLGAVIFRSETDRPAQPTAAVVLVPVQRNAERRQQIAGGAEESQ